MMMNTKMIIEEGGATEQTEVNQFLIKIMIYDSCMTD